MSMLTFMIVDPAINRDKLMKVIMNYYVFPHFLFMYVYVYLCVYIYICVCLHLCLCVLVCMCVYICCRNLSYVCLCSMFCDD